MTLPRRESVKTYLSNMLVDGVSVPCIAVVITPHPTTQQELEDIECEIKAGIKSLYQGGLPSW